MTTARCAWAGGLLATLAGLTACEAFSAAAGAPDPAGPGADGGPAPDADGAGPTGDGGTPVPESGPDGPLPPIAAGTSCASRGACVIFTTSTTFQGGGLDGTAGADGRCNFLASGVTDLKGRSFRAWLGTANTSPKDDPTFTKSTFPYIDVRKAQIAKDWNDLVDGALAVSLKLDENGLPATGLVWTGLTAAGTGTDAHCQGWTSPTGQGWVGTTASQTETWSMQNVMTCSQPARLYCVEQ